MLINFAVYLPGNKSNKICEPSNGGIGSRLNTNKNTLKNTPYHNKFVSILFSAEVFAEIKCIIIKSKIARIKFESGPAIETLASSIKGLPKLFLLIGTGFAQPISANPEAKEAKGISTVPIKSICLRGFKVKRPICFAVSSPSLSAIKACANS